MVNILSRKRITNFAHSQVVQPGTAHGDPREQFVRLVHGAGLSDRLVAVPQLLHPDFWVRDWLIEQTQPATSQTVDTAAVESTKRVAPAPPEQLAPSSTDCAYFMTGRKHVLSQWGNVSLTQSGSGQEGEEMALVNVGQW
jgi:hypothetical protein